MEQSRFGRIPQTTISLMEQLGDQVRREILPVLPTSAAQTVRNATIEQVIGIALRDWRENNNTEGLLQTDIEDLKNFVRAAADIAGADLNGTGLPVYNAVLKALLEDWLTNWNAPGNPGPPRSGA